MQHSHERHKLAASCGLNRIDTSLSWSCIKHFAVIKLQHQVCENQTCCNLIFADFLQVVETTSIKLVDKKSWQSTCIKPVDNKPMTARFLSVYVFFLFLFAGFFRIFQRTTSLCFRKIAITGQLLAINIHRALFEYMEWGFWLFRGESVVNSAQTHYCYCYQWILYALA